jgi:hypothetical protein
MIKQIISFLVFIVISSIVFTGCPYSAEVPLSKASIAVNHEFLGDWEINSEYTDLPDYMDISLYNIYKFNLKRYQYDNIEEKYSETFSAICHFTLIDDTKFINAYQEGIYYFFKIDMKSANEFDLYEVTDNIAETFQNTTDLYEFFSTYKDLSFFYNKNVETYTKRKTDSIK